MLRIVNFRYRFLTFVFVLWLLTAPVGAATKTEEQSRQGTGKPATGQPVSEVKPVKTSELGTLLFHPVREAPATVLSLNNSTISAEIPGQLTDILVNVGSEVVTDDVLAVIDCKPYEIAQQRASAALNSAYARNKYAKQRLKDAERLRKSRSISADTFNMRQSEANALAHEVGMLAADLEEAKRRVSKCYIKAPYDSVVVKRMASVGDYLVPGAPVTQIVDLNHLEVSANIQQQDINSLKNAGKFTFIAEGHEYPVAIRTTVPLINSRIRSFESRLNFLDKAAPPGSAGRLRWHSKEPHIPADFVVERGGKLGIFIAQDGYARFYPIAGARSGLPVPIDLPEKSFVITTGRYSLLDGQPIEIKDD